MRPFPCTHPPVAGRSRRRDARCRHTAIPQLHRQQLPQLLGLIATACVTPILGQAWSFPSALVLYMFAAVAAAFVITPSLVYMGEATTDAGVRSFGVAYGLYNLSWGVGLLAGPAIGGFLFERIGLSRLLLLWAPPIALVAFVLTRIKQTHPAAASHPVVD